MDPDYLVIVEEDRQGCDQEQEAVASSSVAGNPSGIHTTRSDEEGYMVPVSKSTSSQPACDVEDYMEPVSQPAKSSSGDYSYAVLPCLFGKK